jgi:hypothetical protein
LPEGKFAWPNYFNDGKKCKQTAGGKKQRLTEKGQFELEMLASIHLRNLLINLDGKEWHNLCG